MPARFCSRCGKEVSSAARFCPHCGAALTGGAADAAVTRMDTAARSTRRLALPLAIITLVVLAVVVAVLANKLHEESLLASRSAPVAAPPLTNAPMQPLSALPLTNAPTQPAPAAPPMTNAPSTGPGQLPPDVAAYVKFLQGIETQRVALDNDPEAFANIVSSLTQAAHDQQQSQNQELNDPDDTPTPTNGNSESSQVNAAFTSYEVKWQGLIKSFQSMTPPQPCVELANHYSRFLTNDFSVVVQLHVGVDNQPSSTNSDDGSTSGDSFSSLKGNALSTQATRDKEGTNADAALAALCQSYNAPKPFNISPEGSSGSLLGQ